MANRNAPFGLQPVSHTTGGNWNGKTTRYYIQQSDTNAYAVGDLVSAIAGSGSGVINNQTVDGIPLVTKAGLVATYRGVITAITPAFSDLGTRVIPATKLQGYFVDVADDPTLIFAVQCDSSTALASTVIGQYADVSIAGGAGGLGVSGTQLASASIATSPGLPLRIVGLAGGDMSAYAVLLVTLNLHDLASVPQPVVVRGVPAAASRNALASDFDQVIRCASGIAITVQADSAYPQLANDPNGTYLPTLTLLWYGTTTPTFVAGSGVTIHGSAPTKLQYQMISLTRIGANEWTYP